MIGVITEVLPDARYRVTLENGHELIGYANGKMENTTSVSLPATK